MKIKSFYIYIAIFILIIIALIIIDSSSDSAPEKPVNSDNSLQSNTLPQDSIHQGLGLSGSETPSGANVKKSVLDRMKTMEEEVKKNPNDTLKMREFANFMAAAHQPEKAIEYLNKVLKRDPNRIDILLELTSIYFNLKKYPQAEKVTNRILKINPNNSSAHYNLGVLKAVEGKKEEARKIWQDVVSKFPKTNAAQMAKSSLEKL